MNWQVFPAINWTLDTVWVRLFVAANGHTLTEVAESYDQCMSIQYVCQQAFPPPRAGSTFQANASQNPGDQSSDCTSSARRWRDTLGRCFGPSELGERTHSARHPAADLGAEPARTQGLAAARRSGFHSSSTRRTRTGLHNALCRLVVVGAPNHRLGPGASRPCPADRQTHAGTSDSSRFDFGRLVGLGVSTVVSRRRFSGLG